MRYWIYLALVIGCSLPVKAEESVVTGHVELIAPGERISKIGQGNTAVWLTPLGGSTAGPFRGDSKLAPRLVQRNKAFEPRIVILRAGTAVEFPNHDPFFHNVFSLFEGKRFDLGLYEAGGTRIVHFDRVGISYIFCNIHPDMSAVVIAVPTTYYTLSDASGNVTIHGVPPGRYLLHIWNERGLPEATGDGARELTVSAPTTSFGSVRMSISASPEPSHKNKYGRDYDPSSPSNPIYEQH